MPQVLSSLFEFTSSTSQCKISSKIILLLCTMGSRKKRSSLNGRAVKAQLPPPSSLMAVAILERWKKKVKKKVIFSLMAQPFNPPPS